MTDLLSLFRQSVAGLRVLVAATVLLGIAYPLLVTGVATVAFPWQARGSLVTSTGAPTTSSADAVGSALIASPPTDGLFQPRASAAGEGWDPLNSYGSNLGPESAELLALVEERRAEVADREGVAPGAVPPDALTASGSGLDPHISPEYAALQVDRVAAANDLDPAVVRDLVAEHTDGRTLGVLGEPRVNVVLLNLAVLRAARG